MYTPSHHDRAILASDWGEDDPREPGIGEYQRVFRCSRCGADVQSADGYRAHLLAAHPEVIALFEDEALCKTRVGARRWNHAVKAAFLLVLRSAGFGWEALSAWRRGPRRNGQTA